MERTSTSITEDLKTIPEDVRESARQADRRLQEMTEDKPALAKALDVRMVAIVALAALGVAFVARLAGLGFLLSLLLFVVLFAGGWFALANAAAPRRPNR